MSQTTLHSSIAPKGLNAAARVSELVSQARPWTKILRWIGSESTVLVMCSMIDGVFDAASLRIEMSWSLPNGSRSFLILSRFVSSSSSSSSSSSDDDDDEEEDLSSDSSSASAAAAASSSSSSSSSDSDEEEDDDDSSSSASTSSGSDSTCSSSSSDSSAGGGGGGGWSLSTLGLEEEASSALEADLRFLPI